MAAKKGSILFSSAGKKGTERSGVIDIAEIADSIDFTPLESEFDINQGGRFLLKSGELRSVTVMTPPNSTATLAKLKDMETIDESELLSSPSPSPKDDKSFAHLKGEKHRGSVQLLLFSDLILCVKAGKGPAKSKSGQFKAVPVGFPVMLKSMVLQDVPPSIHDAILKFEVRFGDSFHYVFKCNSEAEKKDWISSIFGAVDWLKSVYKWTLSTPSKKHTEVRVVEASFPKTKFITEADGDTDLSSFISAPDSLSTGDESSDSSSVYSAVSAAMAAAAESSQASGNDNDSNISGSTEAIHTAGAANKRLSKLSDYSNSSESLSSSKTDLESSDSVTSLPPVAQPINPKTPIKRHLSESTISYRMAGSTAEPTPSIPRQLSISEEDFGTSTGAGAGASASAGSSPMKGPGSASGSASGSSSNIPAASLHNAARRGSTFYLSMSKRLKEKKKETSAVFGETPAESQEDLLATPDPMLAAAAAQSDPSVRVYYVCENGKDVMVVQTNEGSVLAPTVLAGIPDKLIERLADENEIEPGYVDIMLLTYRQFKQPVELFEMLVGRFNILPEENPTPEDLKYFQKWKRPIQTKVLKVILEWVQHHWPDFRENPGLLKSLNDFIPEILHSGYTFAHKYIRDTVEKNKIEWENLTVIYETYSTERKSKGLDSIVRDIDPKVLAEQMTLYDANIYQKIHPREFINHIWPPKDKEKSQYAPFLSTFISRFDTESYWVATEIVFNGRDPKTQAELISKFIMVAKHCLTLNNYYSVFSVMGGLHFPVIRKLKAAWELLPEKVVKAKERIEQIMNPSRNMRAYREAIGAVNPSDPVLPFLPVYLKDLVFINDGNQKTINEMVNFDKLRMMAKVVYKMYDYGRESYKIDLKRDVQTYLNNARIVRDVGLLTKQMKANELAVAEEQARRGSVQINQ